MPTFSSSSVHLSKLVTRRPRTSTLSGATTEPEKAADQSDGVMKGQQDPKKVISSNGYAMVKKVVRYRECRKNHAASVGGYAVDGCLEFMASGEEGTTAALKCAACCCHRSFHKREVEREVLRDCSSNSASPR